MDLCAYCAHDVGVGCCSSSRYVEILEVLGRPPLTYIAVFLSAARTKLAIPVQSLFLLLNGVGILTSIVYDVKTPDLYENNAHHKIGWAVTWIAMVWVLLSLLNSFSLRKSQTTTDTLSSDQMTSQAMAEYQRLQDYQAQSCRWSDDSGHGTERSSASLCFDSRSTSQDDIHQKYEPPQTPEDEEHDNYDEHDDREQQGLINHSAIDRMLSRRVPRISSARISTGLNIIRVVLERCQPILAFLAICTGAVTWGGLFVSFVIPTLHPCY